MLLCFSVQICPLDGLRDRDLMNLTNKIWKLVYSDLQIVHELIKCKKVVYPIRVRLNWSIAHELIKDNCSLFLIRSDCCTRTNKIEFASVGCKVVEVDLNRLNIMSIADLRIGERLGGRESRNRSA